jgi:Tol biopolymer transport system component/DNA-binding winged helix-turn-helix (wHTH) protein
METVATPKRIARFGAFEFDLRTGEVRKNGAKRKLCGQPFQVLTILLENADEVVDRETLRKLLWSKDTFVDFDHSLRVAISKIRNALNDSAESPRFVENVRGRGYRFIGPVRWEDADRPAEPGDGRSNGAAPDLARAGSAQQLGEPSADRPDAVLKPAGGVERAQGRRDAVATDQRAQQAAPLHHSWKLITLAAAGVVLGLHFARRSPPPRVVASTRITFDGRPKGRMVLDTSRIYFFSDSRLYYAPYEPAGVGQDPVPLHEVIENGIVNDVSKDASELLAGNCARWHQGAGCQLWILPLVGDRRFARHVVDAANGAWSHDGRQIVYVRGHSLFRARPDGTQPRKIVTMNQLLFWPRWSPDARRVRFTAEFPARESALWEVDADGTHLHPLLPGWNSPPDECCGSWTHDGRYFIFQSSKGGIESIWAVRQDGSFFHKLTNAPVRLTSGPQPSTAPLPSIDGKKIFVLSGQRRGELVRYSVRSHAFSPYLSGISATGVAFSRDQKWVAYASYPDHTLWRSKADGAERRQLTFAPLIAFMPRWSPDSTLIAFQAQEPGRPRSVYVISSDGGKPQRVVPGDRDACDPTWSPDGIYLLFGRAPREEPPGLAMDLEILDLRTRMTSKIPGSEGLWFPRWSRDGARILAVTKDDNRLMLFDWRTRNWTKLARMNGIDYPEWSRNSNYIYFVAGGSLNRVRIADHKLHTVVSLKDFHRAPGWGMWAGLTPDDSPLLVRDNGIEEIYALNVRLP